MAMFVWKIESLRNDETFVAYDGTEGKLYNVDLSGNVMSISLLKQVENRIILQSVDLADEQIIEIANQITPDGIEEYKEIPERRYTLKLAKD